MKSLHDVLHRILDAIPLSPGEREELHEDVNKLATGAENAAETIMEEIASTPAAPPA